MHFLLKINKTEGSFHLEHNGKKIIAPLSDFPRLANATEEQLKLFRISDTGIHWSEIDEDISFAGLIREYDKYVLRQFDKFDGWIDVSGHLSEEEAHALYQKETFGGTRYTRYSDPYYFSIFPANTRMIYTPESLGR
jgi:hypothetical protein